MDEERGAASRGGMADAGRLPASVDEHDPLLTPGLPLARGPRLLHTSGNGTLLLVGHLSTTPTFRRRRAAGRARWCGSFLRTAGECGERRINLGDPVEQRGSLGSKVVDNSLHRVVRPLSRIVTTCSDERGHHPVHEWTKR